MGVAFGKYQLIAALGSGGMADVYLAGVSGPVGFRKLVVVKKIREGATERSELTSMLLDEAQLAARLQHPNVVQTFDVGVHDGETYMAMEYLEGQPLARIMRVGGRPPSGFTARVMGDALAGLHYAHELADYDGKPLGIVHRDVSPQNLFVTYAGETKVVDFGIAKMNVKHSENTATGVLKGKLAYMAPEQIKGAEVDARTDVFAAGIVFWEMLTGRRLFKTSNEGEGIAVVLYKEIDRPSAWAPDTPKELEEICMRALKRDPAERWQSAGDMREALYRFMEHGGGMRRDDAGRYVASLFEKEREDVKKQITAFMASAGDASVESLHTLQLTSTDVDASKPTRPSPAATSGGTAILAPSLPPAAPEPGATPAKTARAISKFVAGLITAAFLGLAAGAMVYIARGAHREGDRADAGAAPASASAVAPVNDGPATLTLGGSGTIGVSAAPSLVEAFLKKRGATNIERRPGRRVDDALVVATMRDGARERISILSDGTSQGFTCLADHSCDVAMAAREILPAEATDLAAKGVGDMHLPGNEHVMALDGIAVIVHPNNPLRSIERTTLGTVFAGETKDWSAISPGGPRGPIELVAHEEGSGTTDVFRTLVLGGRELPASAQRKPDNDAIADTVATTPNAIGFVGLAFTHAAKTLAIGDKPVPPMLPTPFTVTTEAYPLTRRFYLYTPSPAKPLALELVDFISSSEGQKLVRAAGLVDLDVTLKNAEPCAHCPAEYAAATKSARRLSLDFRFRGAGNDLDARATRDLERVVSFLREHPTSKIMLFGFAEPTRDPKADVKRSRELARAVDAELAARGVRATSVEGFGGKMPLRVGDGEAARAKNRRVEIWIQSDR